jgi:mannosylglycerate hydrolase
MIDKYKLHVISHTHWDREWYLCFQDFRARLVDLIDYLLELMEKNHDYKYFHLDGQTVVLEDYLEIRPENESRLRKLIAQGRVLIGPWYVLPDEFLVSAEAMVRNLILGHRIASDFGNTMKVGHIPDTFGHISQMPQILKGFDIDNAILFRGITADQVKSEFLWIGADGSKILVAKMSDDTAYSNYFYELENTLKSDEPIDFTRLRNEVGAMIDERATYATTQHLLCMDGVDHIFPNPKTPEIIEWINDNFDGAEAVHTTLPQYIDELKRNVSDLQEYSGELRISNRKWRLQALLAGVLSSRIHLKQANESVQTFLEKWVEPVCTFAWLMGDEYPYSYIWKSWKYVLKNHPHDSICGCSIDQVHDDMMYRFEQSSLISDRLVDQGLRSIAARIDTSYLEDREQTIVVFNPLSWNRTDVMNATICIPAEQDPEKFGLFDTDGNEVRYQLVRKDITWIRYQTKHDIPRAPRYTKYDVVFTAKDVPALGYTTYTMKPGVKGASTEEFLITGANSMESRYLRVELNSNGTLTITSKDTGCKYEGILYFEDGGDAGDGYNYIKPREDNIYTSVDCDASIEPVEDGPRAATFKITVTMRVPHALHSDRKARSTQFGDLLITSFVTLFADSKRIDIRTVIDNQVCDHRLRVCFPSGIARAEKSFAEAQFDVVEREIKVPDCSGWKEPQPSFHPQLSFVDVSDGCHGFAVINKGLPEYEVRDDEKRTIMLTLLRAVGGGVGKPEELVKGQCKGEYMFRYSILPHDGDWEDARVWEDAYNHNVPLKAVQTCKHAGVLPRRMGVLELSDESIIVTAVKKCETRNSVIVRLLNISTKDVVSTVKIPFAVPDVYEVNLNEERQKRFVSNCSHGKTTFELRLSTKRLCTLEFVIT